MAGLRFKTPKEMESEYGENWRIRIGWNLGGDMDWLCGTPVPSDVAQNLKESGRGHIFDPKAQRTWHVRLANTVSVSHYTLRIRKKNDLFSFPIFTS